jgi:hypothetical protein
MNIEGRVSRLEREVGDAIPEKEAGDWREREARRLLPLNREIARIAQFEDMPLPSDDELLGRELAALARWPSQKAYMESQNIVCPTIESLGGNP